MFDAGSKKDLLRLGIQRPHFVTTMAEWSPDWLRWFPAKLISGSVTCDRTSNVRWAANLSLSSGTPQGFPNGLHTTGARMRLFRRIRLPRMGVLDIPWGLYRVDRIASTRGSLQVDLYGRELAIQDAGFPRPRVVGPDSLRNVVETLVKEAVPDAKFRWGLNVDPETFVGQVVEDSDRWGLLEGSDTSLSTAYGLEMFFDGTGVFRVNCSPSFWLSQPYRFDEEVDRKILVVDQTTTTREGVPNLVSVTGEASLPPLDDTSSTADLSADQTPIGPAFAWDDNPSSPTYAGPDPVNHPELAGRYGVVTKSFQSSLVTTEIQARQSATTTLANELGSRKQIDFGGALNPALEAGDLLLIHGERHILDSWTADVNGATMTGVSRVLSGATV